MPAHAAHIVGGPLTTVAWCLSIASIAEIGSNRSTSSRLAPTAKVTPSTTLRPKIWNIGRTANTTSSEVWALPGVDSTWAMFVRRFPWVSIAAFGEPAVPLVKISAARSESSRSTIGAGSQSTRSSSITPPSGAKPQPTNDETSGMVDRSKSSNIDRAVGPITTPFAPTVRNCEAISTGGLLGLSGTATRPAPKAAR